MSNNKPTTVKLTKNAHESYEWLRAIVREDATIYTLLRSVSKSGMSRVISFYIIYNNEPYCLDYRIANILNWKTTGRYSSGIRVQGLGMDLGYHIVSQLSYRLFGNEYKLKHRWF